MNWVKYEGGFYTGPELKAGTLCKTKEGEILIIGDLNHVLGVCDCCREDIEYYSTEFVELIEEIKEVAAKE